MAIRNLVFGAVSVVILLSLVSAWGIGTSYWEPDNPLVLKAGESQDVEMNIQNMIASDGNLKFQAELVSGQEIATITDSSLFYEVPSMTENVNVHIRVKIPEDAQIGQKYTIGVRFTPVSDKEEGMVQIVTGIVRRIPVVVGEDNVIKPLPEAPAPQKDYTNIVLLIFVIILLLIILYLLLRKKDKKPAKRK